MDSGPTGERCDKNANALSEDVPKSFKGPRVSSSLMLEAVVISESHAAFLHRDSRGLRRAIADAVVANHAHHRRTVLVHAGHDQAAVLAHLDGSGVDLSRFTAIGALVLWPASAIAPDGRLDARRALAIFDGEDAHARGAGYAGAGFVLHVAERFLTEPGPAADLLDLEDALAERGQARAPVLCVYRVEDARAPGVYAALLRAHGAVEGSLP